jgi:hypothetical protein
MAQLIDFGHRLQQDGVPGVRAVVATFPSFLSFFDEFTREHVAVSCPPWLSSFSD